MKQERSRGALGAYAAISPRAREVTQSSQGLRAVPPATTRVLLLLMPGRRARDETGAAGTWGAAPHLAGTVTRFAPKLPEPTSQHGAGECHHMQQENIFPRSVCDAHGRGRAVRNNAKGTRICSAGCRDPAFA
eukprot:3507926-Prymnesium_polylepis.1